MTGLSKTVTSDPDVTRIGQQCSCAFGLDAVALINGDRIGERYSYGYIKKYVAGRTSKNYVIAKWREYNNDTWVNDNIPFQRIVDRSWMAGRYRAGMHQRGERREGEGTHIEHGSGESKRATRDR